MINYAKNLPADERKAVIVQSVIKLSATQNPSEITTAAIAKQMNLTQGALFRHFANKDAIWLAVIEWVAEQLLHKIDCSAKNIASPLAAMEAMFKSHIEFVAAYPGVPRMVFGELQRAEATPAKSRVHRLIQSYSERLYTLIEKGKHNNELLASLDSSAAATLFIGTIQGLVMQSLIAESTELMLKNASGAFAIYRRGIEKTP